MTTLLQEFRQALRQFRNSPGFAITAILTIALGVGANTAVFMLVHSVMLKSLPVAQPSQLYRVGDSDNCCVWGGMEDDWSLFSHAQYQYFRDHTPAFQDLAAVESWSSIRISVRPAHSQAPAESSSAEWVSGNYFRTLGIPSLLGRTLAPADDIPSAAPVAVLSYRAWQRRFAGNPSIVGSSLDINGKPFTVVGVAPPGFFGDRIAADPAEFWLPLSTEPLLRDDRSLLKDENIYWLYVIGRLPPEAKPAAVEAELNVELRQWLMAASRLTTQQRSEISKQKLRLEPGGIGIAQMQSEFKQGLYLLTAASALVLLIACANLANLLLARAAARRQQLAIRTALGASRLRLVRSTLVESVALSVAGGAAGLLFAFFGARAMVRIVFDPARAFVPISTNPSAPVLLFALAVSIATGLLFGVLPAWLGSRSNPVEALRGAGRATREHSALPQRSLIVVQAALSLVLLAAAGLVTQSLRNLEHQKFGFEAENRYIAFFDPELAGYTTDRLPPMYEELQRRLKQLPGVRSASYAMYIPQVENNWSTGVFPEEHLPEPGKENGASWTRISPEYFESLGTPVLRGRAITEQDTASSRRVAVINEAFARKFFPNEDPMGKRFGKDARDHAADYEIVGITADVKYNDPFSPARAMFFLPFTQTVQYKDPSDRSGEERSMFANNIVLQVSGNPPGLERQVQSVLASLNPNLALLRFLSYGQQVNTEFSQERLLSDLTGLFSILAVLLASVGLYGVTSYRVARRTGEIGIRIALGATPRQIVMLVLRSAFSLILIGLAIGIPLTLGTGRLMASKLFGVATHDVLVLAGAAAVLALAAMVATVAPARKAAGIQPMQALHTE
ncbi:MAG: ABC transporter permease [Acidobacteria bacterium]|nr:ABC transporter permease [Acidobacteriota bacterium]